MKLVERSRIVDGQVVDVLPSCGQCGENPVEQSASSVMTGDIPLVCLHILDIPGNDPKECPYNSPSALSVYGTASCFFAAAAASSAPNTEG
jgi:hypothetical protein